MKYTVKASCLDDQMFLTRTLAITSGNRYLFFAIQMRIIEDDGVGHPDGESEERAAGRDGVAVVGQAGTWDFRGARWGRSLAPIGSPESEGALSVATARQYEGEWREAWPPARRRTQARPGSDSAVGKLMDAT